MGKLGASSKVGLIAIGVVVAIALSCYFFPSVILLGSSSGRPLLLDHHFCTIESPDKQQKIDVFRRIDFPVNEIIDPSGVVTIKLTRFDGIVESTSFQIDEYTDVVIPTVTWNDNGAIVTFIDYGKDRPFELSYSH